MYHYAGNNPVKYTDPTGAFDWDTNTIQPDDCLSQIAYDCNERYGTNYTADDLQALNSDTITDKDKIYAGNSLNLGDIGNKETELSDEQVSLSENNDHHLRDGLFEIGAGLTIWVLTGIEVRNTMLKDPKSTSQVGYGGILAGGALIANGITRAAGASKTTLKEDAISLVESPLGGAVREFNNSNNNGNGRSKGRMVDFSNKEKKEN